MNSASQVGLRTLAWLAMLLSNVSRAAPGAGEFMYHAQTRDTLIGIGRRLLLEPQRWRDVQALNHILDPRRIAPDSILRIPYAWLRLELEAATVVGLAGAVAQGGKPIAVGDLLPQGTVIETGANGSVTLDLADGSVVTVQKSSVLKLDEMVHVAGVASANSIRLKLDTGRVETKAAPHRDVGRFEIITPVAVSAVRGTVFRNGFASVSSYASTETLEGTVSVSGGADSVPVGAGFGTRVEKDRAPIPPVVLLPPPALTTLPPINSTARLQFQLVPVAGARQYRLQLSAAANFQALAADVLTADGVVDFADLADGDYWLRARSVDGLGLEGPDAVRRFTQHLLPAAPLSLSPAPVAGITGSPVRLEWMKTEAASRYALQVAGEAEFVSPVVDRKQVQETHADIDDLPSGRYFWRVAAVNERGEAGPWSAVQTYLQRPAMSIPDVPQREGVRLTFTWPKVDGRGYRAQIARRADFRTILRDERVDVALWSTRIAFPGIYYIRVQSIDAEGWAGGFSPARRFVVPIPLWLQIAVPVAIGLALLL